MRQVTFGRVRELMGYGIPIEAIAAVVPAPGRIALDRTDKLYWPDDDGRAAWIFPVRCVDPADPEAIEYPDPLAVVRTGAIIDLIAFHPDAAGRWALRLGNATVLGAIEPQYLDPPAVPVHRCVVDWLCSGCRGIVLLTRDPIEAAPILRQCTGGISAEDAAHEAELDRLRTMPLAALPPITIRRAT